MHITLKQTISSIFITLVSTACLFAKPVKHIAADTGQIITINNFDIPQLKRQRDIYIYLPVGYATSNKKYPVLYLQDGQNIFRGTGVMGKNAWAVDSILNSMPADKQCIVVGISHGAKYRLTEYNPYDSKYGKEEGIAYVNFLVETLKPYIDQHYRTKKEARYTAVAGSSLGALIATYAAYKYPDVYGSAGVFSSAFWIGPDLYKEIGSHPANKQSGYYLTVGDIEGSHEAEDVIKMDSTLHAAGYSLKQVPLTKINTGAKHNEKQWREAFPAFYAWLIKRF
jgi:predicted alpha/beta superfamily hydrolase